jgi:hypothetical protein
MQNNADAPLYRGRTWIFEVLVETDEGLLDTQLAGKTIHLMFKSDREMADDDAEIYVRYLVPAGDDAAAGRAFVTVDAQTSFKEPGLYWVGAAVSTPGGTPVITQNFLEQWPVVRGVPDQVTP